MTPSAEESGTNVRIIRKAYAYVYNTFKSILG
jgi:hypothetical protein